MAGLGKRHPEYVPADAFRELDRLSRADMEMLWDLALIHTGAADTASVDETLDIVRASHRALRHNGYQGSVRMAEASA